MDFGVGRPLLAGMPETFHVPVKQVARRGCGVSILGDSQTLAVPWSNRLQLSCLEQQCWTRSSLEVPPNSTILDFNGLATLQCKGKDWSYVVPFISISSLAFFHPNTYMATQAGKHFHYILERVPLRLFWNNYHKGDISIKKQSIYPCQMGCQNCMNTKNESFKKKIKLDSGTN